MSRFVIQAQDLYNNWRNLVGREYDTLEAAQADFDKMPIKVGYRIAEAYTVIRYRPVKKKESDTI